MVPLSTRSVTNNQLYKSLGWIYRFENMWCIHSIFSVKSDFLGSTTITCENMMRSSMDAFPQARVPAWVPGIGQHISKTKL